MVGHRRYTKPWKGHLIENVFVWMVIFFLLLGVGLGKLRATYVSNTVGDRRLPVYCVDTNEMKLCLTFDAAWGAEDFPKILEILKEHQVKATFFCTGQWMETYPDCVRALLADGHELGNHGMEHKDMITLSVSDKEDEILDADQTAQKLFGVKMDFFRPPYGSYDNETIRVAENCGYVSVQWSIDSLDWKDYGVKSIISTVVNHKKLDHGGIILLHNGSKYTVDALESLILGLQEKGYSFVTVSELVAKKNYYLDNEGKQHTQKQE